MGITVGKCFVGQNAAVSFVVDAAAAAGTDGTIPGMDTLCGQEVLAAVRGLLSRGGREVDFKRVCTDSRLALPGDLFFALVGERFDGHDFIFDAMSKAVAGVVYQQGRPIPMTPEGVWAIAVQDTLAALGELAAYYRRKMPAKVIAVTGSLGKTTAKAMALHLLWACVETVASPKSFNNSVGVPLTLFLLKTRHRFAVVEMGTSEPGEMRRLAEISRPDMAVLTAIAPVHMEGLGSLKGIAREKADVTHYMSSDGVLIVNGDDRLCMRIADQFHGEVITFGRAQTCTVRADAVQRLDNGIRFVLNHQHEITLEGVRGIHNVHNALAAAAIYLQCGFDPARLPERFRGFRLPHMRMELVELGPRKCLCDCYNANPRSMTAALAELTAMDHAGPRAAVLGDMAELGRIAQPCHEELGRLVAKYRIDLLVAVGDMMQHAADAAVSAGMSPDQVIRFQSADEAKHEIAARVPEGTLFLLKGSRCMGLEVVLHHLQGEES